MKILYKINEFVDVSTATYLVLFIAFITGQFKTIIIFLLLSFIHEMGHLIVAKLYKISFKKLKFLPFGFFLEIEDMPKSSIASEVCIYIAGPLMIIVNALILYLLLNIGFISNVTFNFAMVANVSVCIFNLLPIYPLDGHKIITSIMQIFLPYKKSLKIAKYISIVSLIGLIIFSISEPQWVIWVFLILMQNQFYKELPKLWEKFLIYKTKRQKYKKFKVHEEDDLYREKNNFVVKDKTILDDFQMAIKLLNEEIKKI